MHEFYKPHLAVTIQLSRDTMLAWYMLSSCVSVHPSVTCQYHTKTAKCISH